MNWSVRYGGIRWPFALQQLDAECTFVNLVTSVGSLESLLRDPGQTPADEISPEKPSIHRVETSLQTLWETYTT